MERSWFKRYSSFVSGKKGRWLTVIIWVVLLAVVNLSFPQANTQSDDTAPNFDRHTPSVQAQKLADKEFPSGSGIPALLTWYRSTGITDQDLTDIQSLSESLSKDPLPHQLDNIPLDKMPLPALKKQLSDDGTTFVQPVLFEKKAGTEELNKSIDALKKVTKSTFSDDPFDSKIGNDDQLLVRVTGPVGIQLDATELFSQGDLKLLLGTVVLVLVFLLLIYRSPILALVPLVAVGFAYGVINPILGGMAKAGWITVDSQGLSIMTVLLFGAGTDYCLFLIARFRSHLKEERSKFTALKLALGGSSGAIAMSGLTVVFSLLILLVANFGSVQRFAIPFSLSILIMMIASLTLVPAFLSILGRVSFFPVIPRTLEMDQERAEKKGKPAPKPKKESRIGRKIGGVVIHRPWQITIATILILGTFAFFSTKIIYTFDTLSSFPKDMPSREGFTLISDHFTPGELAPVQVIAQTDGKEMNLKKEIEKLPYVSRVSEPTKGKTDQNLLSYKVELDMNPYSNKAMAHIPDLHKAVEKELKASNVKNSEDKVWIGGQTAEQYDTQQTTDRDASIIIPLIIALIAALLLIYLRSITAMAYLMGTVLLSYFSALGLGWIVLHYFFGVTAIQGLIPLYSFVFIVALGEDYNIFMVSSIWKKSRVMPLKQAVQEGVTQTGSVITSAGLILAGTFAVLATLPIQVLVQFGSITAIGVLLDTFIVRPFLVPSLTVLFGKWAFWPSKQKRFEK